MSNELSLLTLNYRQPLTRVGPAPTRLARHPPRARQVMADPANLRARMVSELGDLPEPWRQAFADVPRHAFNNVVTRGLAHDASLKEVGLAGVSSIPSHWSVLRLKNLVTVQTGLTLGKDYGSAELKEFPYLRVANVQSSGLDLTEVKTVQLPVTDAASVSLRDGDVLMTEGGDIDKLGRATIWRGELDRCLHQNHIFAVRCSERIEPDYLVYLLASSVGRDYFQLTAKQTTNLAATNSTTLRALAIPLPPVEEQCCILKHLRDEHARWFESTQRMQRETELLREFRTRLTFDVVTGQLDAREAAAKLPDLDPAELATADADDSDDIEAVAEEFLDEAGR